MINICFITDENYLIPTMVAIQSLIDNTKNDVCISVITDNLSENSIKIFFEMSTQKVKVNVINMKNPCENINTKHKYVSKSAMMKFLLPEIFKDLDKILYLDGDMLILNDLKTVYDTDLSSFYVAAVADMQEVMRGEFIERTGLKKYFNSGMMLLNLKKMREDNITNKLIENKKNQTHNKFMDQDVLNKTFGEKVIWLSPKYNLMKPNLKYSKEEITNFFNIKALELSKIVKNPSILHLTNSVKPWRSVEAIDYKKWLYYLKKTPESYSKNAQIEYLKWQSKEYKVKQNRKTWLKIKNLLTLKSLYNSETKNILTLLKKNKDKRIVLWGASLFLENFIKNFKIKNPNIIGIIDKNSNRWGNKIGLYEVFSPEKISELGVDAVLLTVKNYHYEIYEDIKLFLLDNYPDVKLLEDPFRKF